MRLTAICLVALAFSSVTAFSQEGTTSPASPGGEPPATVWPAPVGHRQPKMSDLPPDVATGRCSRESHRTGPINAT
jgi:hypothetical protein